MGVRFGMRTPSSKAGILGDHVIEIDQNGLKEKTNSMLSISGTIWSKFDTGYCKNISMWYET